MRKTYTLFVLLAISIAVSAQSSKTIDVTTPGTLGDLIGDDAATVTDLTITGTLNTADFNVFQKTTSLEKLDMAGVTIVDAGGNVTGLFPPYTFYGCKTLKKVTLPSTLQDIGESAFFKCQALEEVTFPEGLKTIGKGAFMSCHKLAEVSLPNSVEKISDRAFYAAPFTKFTMPSSLKTIGATVFYGTLIASVKLPAGVSKIGESAFGGCKNLATFEVEEGNTSFKVVDGVLFSADEKTLIAYPQADPREKYTVPATVDSIYKAAFDCAGKIKVLRINKGVRTLPVSMCYGTAELQKLYISSTVTLLRAGCVDNCPKLKEVHVRATTPPEVETGAFGVMFPNYSMNLYVPTGSLALYEAAPEWKDAFLSYNEEDLPQITMTTAREIGEYVNIGMKVEEDVDITGAEYDENGSFKITDKDIVITGAISKLECSSNKLTKLDVSKAPDLEELYCDDNELTELAMGKSDNLRLVYCGNNKLGSVDLKGLAALSDFSCWGNEMTSIDVSKNAGLTSLVCRDNMIAGTLDLSGNAALREVNCYNNAITAIKLAGNSDLRQMEMQRNDINGEKMTAFMQALPKFVAYADGEWDDWFGMNPQGLYLTEIDMTLEKNKATAADVKIAKDKGWPVFGMNIDDYGLEKPTPYDDILTGVQTAEYDNAAISVAVTASSIDIAGLAAGTEAVLYDANGRIAARKTASGNTVSIATAGLAKGVYVVKASSETRKFVVR